MFRRNHHSTTTTSGGSGGAVYSNGTSSNSAAANGGGATTSTTSKNTTTATTIHSNINGNGNGNNHRSHRRGRRRKQQRNGGVVAMISHFYQYVQVKFEKEAMTLLLMVMMFLLAGGLVRILYQIWAAVVLSAAAASSSGSDTTSSSGDHGKFYFSTSRGIHQRHSAWPGGGGGGGGGKKNVPFRDRPFHPGVYRIPEAHDKVGDRSERYAQLRQDVDAQLPINDTRSWLAVQRLRVLDAAAGNTKNGDDTTFRSRVMDPSSPLYQQGQVGDLLKEPYDVYNCPDVPPRGYPFQWNLVHEILHDWPVNNYTHADIPNEIYNGLCIFDYNKDYDKALTYRRAELPFVIDADPHVARTVERWSTVPNYLERLLGEDTMHRAEHNTNNHFLYTMPSAPPKRRGGGNRRGAGGPQPPHELQDLHGRRAQLQNQAAAPNAMRMTFRDWLAKANVSSSSSTTSSSSSSSVAAAAGPNDEHWYFRLVGCGYLGPDGSCDKGSSEYLFDELPYLQPSNNDTSIYMGKDGEEQKGIHCRFGMQGVLAENHFDGTRNTIVVLRGMRRYIISHPNQCDKLALLPMGHASARHSAIDYTQPDLQLYPEFEQAMANEVVLQAGQVLYLPTNWFHYIVSLNLNMQCNARSGESDHYKEPIEACGF